MSDTGWWGDKIIVVLQSDGRRRHKKWCKHYSYGECDKLCGKCIGSAFCEQYVNGIAEAEPVWRSREDVNRFDEKRPEATSVLTRPRTLKLVKRELYRQAGRTENLIGKTVMVRNTPHTFRIGEVVEESFDHMGVEYGGRIHTYVKKVAFRNEGVYVLEEEGCFYDSPEGYSEDFYEA